MCKRADPDLSFPAPQLGFVDSPVCSDPRLCFLGTSAPRPRRGSGLSFGQQVKKMERMLLWLPVLAGLLGIVSLAGLPEARIRAHPSHPSPGAEVELICEVSGGPGPWEFLWEKEDVLQRSMDSVFFIPSFGKNDTGTYTCTATSPTGRVIAEYHLETTNLKWLAFIFPRKSKDSAVLVNMELDEPLRNFSVCLRYFTEQIKSYALFSYATRGQDNDILLYKHRLQNYRLYVGGEFVSFNAQGKESTSRGWIHVCASWESSTGIAELWVNGMPLPRKALQADYAVSPEAAVVLGQEQDSYGGRYNASQAFVGEVTDVYMWDFRLAPDEVRSISEGWDIHSPALLDWRNFPYEMIGHVFLKPRLS
ncbi:serum amyloid P-component-like [Alligator sinensis]|uniref:C-reactive protein n=1 Tax=Alligator sinensis TaxID=38654 RepID=A0A1U7RUV9_ALLSI|nr:serum amyloid P-component-like [Alligator sinensis]